MNDLVNIENGRLRVDSKIIADAFGKIHRNVLRDIDGLDCSEKFRVLNFEQSSYQSAQGKTLPCISMTKDGFCFLAMGFTGEKAAAWKEAFIDAFNQMETAVAAQRKGVMQSLSEAIALLESDKAIASESAKVLSRWKKIRKQHIEAVTTAHAKAQLVLNFSDK